MDSKYIVLLLSLQAAFGFEYPLYGGGRYNPLTSSRRPLPFRSIPAISRSVDYPVADYDDGYIPTDQVDFDYSDKYEPYKYGPSSISSGPSSLVPFYRPKEYYIQKIPRKTWDRASYYDDEFPPQAGVSNFDALYDDPSWLDDPANAEASQAFLRNLLMAQLYHDSKYPTANRYDFENGGYYGRKYDYGIPTTNIDESEKVRRYFLGNGFDAVKELEALAGKGGKGKEVEGKEGEEEKEPTGKPENLSDIAEKLADVKSKIDDAKEYFNMQKQLILNNRKSNTGPIAEGFRMEKKQIYDPRLSKFFDFGPFPDESTTNSIKKLNMIKEKTVMNELPTASTTLAPASTTTLPQKPGQKEVVLPRPSNPARRPYPEISTRSMNPPSVYDTIKKLLDMEKEAENTQKTRAQPQKRFAMTDDPLTAELAQLKKSSA